MNKITTNIISKNNINSLWKINNQESIIYKIFKTFTELICHLPKPIKKSVLSFIDFVILSGSRCLSLLNQLYLKIYLIQEMGKNNGPKNYIYYLSNNSIDTFLIKTLFTNDFKIKEIGKIFIWEIKKKKFNNLPDIDAIFINCDIFYSHFFEKQGLIILPEWISMEMDTSKPINDIHKSFSKSIKEDLRKVNNNGFSYELTDDLDKLKLFYYKMYLPYTKRRYGKSAQIYNYIAIRHLFERGFKLMLIKKDGEYVLGSLFSVKKDTLITKIMGIMDGKTYLLKNGLGCAAYYFTLLWAKENDIKKLNYGTSRPFLNDGVFQYKKKWGTIIKKVDNKYYSKIYAFQMYKNSKGIQDSLLNKPFICINNNQLKTMIFLKDKNQIKPENITQISKKYKISCYDKYEIISPQDLV